MPAIDRKCFELSTASKHGQRGSLAQCREKFGPRPIFKIFSLDQIRVDQEKNPFFLVERENFENRPRPKFFSALCKAPPLTVKQTTSHGLVLRVYASQWNWACTVFKHVETKTEEVVFSRRSWLSFIVGVRSELVRSYDRHLPVVVPWLNFTPNPQQVQAERFSFRKRNWTSQCHKHVELSLSRTPLRLC